MEFRCKIIYILYICEVKHIYFKMNCLIFLLLLAIHMDIVSYKVKNHLILSGVILGLMIQLYEVGWFGIVVWLCGVIAPIILLFPLFLIKGLGAGDIKLFSVIGGFYGVSFVLKSIITAFIVAAIISIIYLIKYNQVFNRLQHLVNYIQTMFKANYLLIQGTGKIKLNIIPYYNVKRDGYNGVIHFSIAIFVAVLVQIIMH